jgi:uncharacterized protein (TIGR00251 family)
VDSQTTNPFRLSLRVIPNAKRTEIVGWIQESIKIKLQAPPTEGRANAVLLEFFANKLSLPKNSIRLISGKTSRNKIIEISGSTVESSLRTLGLSPK